MAIEKNSVVSMYYELKDANTGELLESNTHAEPLSFILGKGQILEGLEDEISKLDCPSNADIVIKKEKALGAHLRHADGDDRRVVIEYSYDIWAYEIKYHAEKLCY